MDRTAPGLSGPNASACSMANLVAGLGSIEFVPPSAYELDTRLMNILERVVGSTSATWGAMHVTEADALYPLVQTDVDVPSLRCREGGGALCCDLALQVARTGKTVCFDDVGNHFIKGSEPTIEHRCEGGEGLSGSLFLCPVLSEQGDSLGVLELGGCHDQNGESCGFAGQAQALAHTFAGQAGAVITNARLAAQLRQAQFETIFRLSVAAEFRDTETAAHVQRMSRYTEVIARGLGLSADEVEIARFASPMHDVGKLGVPDNILLKPGPLTPTETQKMRSHTVIGSRILGGSDSVLLRASEKVALTHHERVDGRGYPQGLRGDSIPTIGRIVALADALDAITSRRCYKEAKGFEEGIEICQRDAGTHFDAQCVEALEKGADEALRIHTRFTDEDTSSALTFTSLRLVI